MKKRLLFTIINLLLLAGLVSLIFIVNKDAKVISKICYYSIIGFSIVILIWSYLSILIEDIGFIEIPLKDIMWVENSQGKFINYDGRMWKIRWFRWFLFKFWCADQDKKEIVKYSKMNFYEQN